MAIKFFSAAKAIDDFIIDRVLQPWINVADWQLGLPLYTIARALLVLGGGMGVIWLHRFDAFGSVDFYEDTLCVGIMVIATYIQIRVHEAREPKRQAFMPAARLTGLIWRTIWLVDLLMFPLQWPVESHNELVLNFGWTFLVVLPYWVICCRRAPPPVATRERVLSPVTIGAR